jgi:flagellar biosynthetic protein FlhB
MIVSIQFLIAYWFWNRDVSLFPSLVREWRNWLQNCFDADLTFLRELATLQTRLQGAVSHIVLGCGLLSAGALSFQLLTTRGYVSFTRLKPNLGRAFGISRIGGQLKDGLRSALVSLLLSLGLGVAFWFFGSNLLLHYGGLLRFGMEAQMIDQGGWLRPVVRWGAIILTLYGLFDLFREKRRYDGEMRMTKQEVKEEFKEGNGNPEVKARIRSLMKALAGKRMMQQVPKATVVITNPTHYAIAIQYIPGETNVPRVLAKGVDHMAFRIRKVALEREIPIIENPPLAQALYKSVEIGQEIPMHLYRAVAEVLAYVYRVLDRQWKP